MERIEHGNGPKWNVEKTKMDRNRTCRTPNCTKMERTEHRNGMYRTSKWNVKNTEMDRNRTPKWIEMERIEHQNGPQWNPCFRWWRAVSQL